MRISDFGMWNEKRLGRMVNAKGGMMAVLLLALLLSGKIVAQSSDSTTFEVAVSKYLMGTTVDLNAWHSDVRACQQAAYHAFREMERVEGLLSFQKEDSEISRINRAAGRAAVKVSPEAYEIIRRSQHYSESLNGWFDITVGPLSELWGFSGEGDPQLPDSSLIASLLNLINFRDIELIPADTSVFLPRAGMKIDLGGIAKGYAIDRGVAVLQAKGVGTFLLNAGGDVYASGLKNGTAKWRIGVKHPRRLQELIAILELSDAAVATSGDYERYFEREGKRYHHILDPRSGYPAGNCRSVTVVAKTAEEADALATCLFVAGYPAFRSGPRPDIPFFLVDAEGTVHYSKAMAEGYHLQIVENK